MLVLGESIYVGNSAITQIYQGNNLIWPAASGDGYYYYYQSPSGMTEEQALAVFNDNKQIGPVASSTTQFSFRIYTRYSEEASPATASVVCFAIPIQTGTLGSITGDWSGTKDVTSLFINSYNIVYIDNIPYYLYYHRALWRSGGTVTVVVSQNSN